MEPDKVGYSRTLKVGLPNFGSADVQVSFTSSVREGETEEQAHSRVVSFVESKLETEKAKLEILRDAATEPTKAPTSTPAPVIGAGAAPPGFPGTTAASSVTPPTQTPQAPIPTTSAPTGVPLGFPSGAAVVAPQNDLQQLQDAAGTAPTTQGFPNTAPAPISTQPAAEPIAASENDDAIAAIQAKYGINTQQQAPTNVAALKR